MQMPTSPTGSDQEGDAAGDALARCVGDPGRFVAGSWGRAPLYRPGADAAGFADLFSLAAVDELVGITEEAPAFRVPTELRYCATPMATASQKFAQHS